MRKAIVILLQAIALLAMGQVSAETPRQGTPASQKVIKDRNEYNAYMAALNMQDPVQMAAAMEAFAKQYPQSVVVTDALEQAMAAYQRAGNAVKVEETTRKLLQMTPTNIRALSILVYLDRAKASSGADQAAMEETCSNAQQGLQQLPGWQRPEGTSDSDFEQLHNQVAGIFYGASGFCALQKKDYAGARTFLEQAFHIDPSNVSDLYPLAVADLEMKPLDVTGFWYLVRAAYLAQAAHNDEGAKQMLDYAKRSYKKYHGNEDGWNEFSASVAAQAAPPPAAELAKAIRKAPTPCEIAVQAVHDNKPEDLSFADDEYILQHRDCSPSNKEAADLVWTHIQEMEKNGEVRIKMVRVKVIRADKNAMDVAITEDNQSDNVADLHVVFEKPVLRPPAVGSLTDVIGVLTGYTPSPFLFTMEKGELPKPKETSR
jgi:tetratricopeptide (TPR) repeat protein